MTGAQNFPERALNTRQAVVRAAKRHSRIVRTLRIALPVSAVLAMAAIAAAIVLDPRAMLAEVDAESLGISGTKIVMEFPKFSGYQRAGSDGQAKNYEVMASRAEQHIAKPDEIDLFEIKARMDARTDGWMQLMASNGHFNKAQQILDLSRTIEITTDLGESANLTVAKIDFAKGEIASPQPVVIKFERADLNADSMELYETGERAVFKGNVVMTIKPDTTAPVAPHSIEGLQ